MKNYQEQYLIYNNLSEKAEKTRKNLTFNVKGTDFCALQPKIATISSNGDLVFIGETNVVFLTEDTAVMFANWILEWYKENES